MNDDSSRNLHSDLESLYDAGAVRLPQVAAQYAKVAQALHKTALSEESAFTRSIGGPLGPLYYAWTALRDTMQDEVAVKSHDNLVAAGEALTQISEGFADQDHLNARYLGQFRDHVENIDDEPVPDDRPPEHMPDAPSTSDDHPLDYGPLPDHLTTLSPFADDANDDGQGAKP
ncbi:MAG: hypothetical protein ACRDXX_19585 [Stackebrandtia sp.]